MRAMLLPAVINQHSAPTPPIPPPFCLVVLCNRSAYKLCYSTLLHAYHPEQFSLLLRSIRCSAYNLCYSTLLHDAQDAARLPPDAITVSPRTVEDACTGQKGWGQGELSLRVSTAGIWGLRALAR